MVSFWVFDCFLSLFCTLICSVDLTTGILFNYCEAEIFGKFLKIKLNQMKMSHIIAVGNYAKVIEMCWDFFVRCKYTGYNGTESLGHLKQHIVFGYLDFLCSLHFLAPLHCWNRKGFWFFYCEGQDEEKTLLITGNLRCWASTQKMCYRMVKKAGNCWYSLLQITWVQIMFQKCGIVSKWSANTFFNLTQLLLSHKVHGSLRHLQWD